MTSTSNYYELLEIERGATPEEIKRSWARLVRVHTPDKDPEGNRRINEAKATLLDPGARQDYDALLDFGGDIDDLLDKAQLAEFEEDWEAAIEGYQEILALHPTNHVTRYRLALCQSHSNDYPAARKTLENLLSKQDQVPMYWMYFARVLEECEDVGETERLERAREAYERAIQLEPHNATNHLALSRHWCRREEFQLAEECIEKAVHADGKVDIDDVETLAELPVIHLLAGQMEKLADDAERIRSLIPEDNKAVLAYAAYCFLRLADQLAKLGHFEKAMVFVKTSEKVHPLSKELEDWVAWVERSHTLTVQADELKNDRQMANALVLLSMGLLARDNDEIGDERFCEIFSDAVCALAHHPLPQVQAAVDRLRNQYPAIYAVSPEIFASVRQVGKPVDGKGKSGCFVLPAALSLVALVFVFVSYVL